MNHDTCDEDHDAALVRLLYAMRAFNVFQDQMSEEEQWAGLQQIAAEFFDGDVWKLGEFWESWVGR